MRISDLQRVDGTFRLWRKAETLITAIKRRQDYHQKHNPHILGPTHKHRAHTIEDALREAQQGSRTLWEINTYLSSRDMNKINAKDTMAYIFDGLPEPKQAQHDDYTHQIIELMNHQGRTKRAQTHKFHLQCEMAWQAKQNAYMIFNTLTVEPGQYYKVFTKDSKAFKDYIRKYARQTGDENEHTYFAAVEAGAKNGRLHIHVLHMSKHPPHRHRDPNTARPHPTMRELACIKPLWPHGHSSPIIVRYSPQDAWGKLSYRWPIDKRTDKPLKISHPMRLASYISKYITKSYTLQKRTEYLWRIRKSHNLGQKLLESLMKPLSSKQLLITATDPAMRPTLNNQKCPHEPLRLAALRLYKHRHDHYSKNQSDTETSTTEVGKQLKPRLSMLHAARDSKETSRDYSLQRIGYMKMLNINEEETYDQAWLALQATAKQINETYFPKSTDLYGSTTTEDNIYSQTRT